MDDNSDDKLNWKFGIFFFNPDNRKVFVSKRIGIGWTLNFARWQALLFVIGLLVMVLFSILRLMK